MVCDAWHIEIIYILGIVCSHKLHACELLKKVLFTADYLKRVLSKVIYEITWSRLKWKQ